LFLEQLQSRILPLRKALIAHPIYDDLRRPQALRTFMEHHVFAVWDFMSLLKALQQRLCSVAVPWMPSQDAAHSRFINEIVLAEESDDDGQGGFASHFELYRRCMTGFGADTSSVEGCLARLRRGQDIRQALSAADLPLSVRQFVGHTFDIIESGDLCRIAAAFAFGREDLLPAVFQKIVDELAQQAAGTLDPFQYYLRRHIELDGDEHGPTASRLVIALCGDDEANWQAATSAARESLEARLAFWDSIHRAITVV
jgi:DUF3050 family protein